MMMRLLTRLCTYGFLGLTAIVGGQTAMAQESESAFCQSRDFEGKNYTVCQADPQRDDIRLFLRGNDGSYYQRFRPLAAELQNENYELVFAMNAGMYHENAHPVGLYVEKGEELSPISTKSGEGNFHMLPNGVFYLANNQAFVRQTEEFLKEQPQVDYATQSGPMLVINGQLHPRFIINSPYLQYRNGVGVDNLGHVQMVISNDKVNFEEMARFMRDDLHCANALYLDGSISSLYAPQMGRRDWWHALGPILAVVRKQPAQSEQMPQDAPVVQKWYEWLQSK